MSKATFKPKDAPKSEPSTYKSEEMTLFQKISTVWTFISAGYAVASTCSFIAKGWVDSVYAYALIPMLVVFIGVFIALVVMSVKNPQNAKSNVKTYKKILGIFKAFANVFLLAIGVVSMVGLALNQPNLAKWIVFGITFAVALLQLVFKVTTFALKCAKRNTAKKYDVRVSAFRDGKKRRKSIADSVKENGYKNK